jgi:hypothetical protein
MSTLHRLTISLCLFTALGMGWGRAQHTRDVPGVQAALTTFFEALNQGDADMMAPLLADSLEMVSIFERRGEPNLRKVPAVDFLAAVGRPREQSWLEVTRNVRVNLDGFLAQAWMDYTFFLGDSLHHCGVNNFTLFYDGEKWVVIGMVDTQRKLNCQ